MIKYIKCPRCELNYIDPEKQEYCDVCIAEMKGNKLQFADIDDEEFDENAEKTEICPVCGVNTMRYGEKMCDACKQASQYEEDQDINMDTDEEWKNYLEDDEDLTVDDETLEEELSDMLATKVSFKLNAKGSGQLVIDFSDLDVLDGLIRKIRQNP